MTGPLYAASASEDEFRQAVQQYATLRGWLVHHQRPGRTADGWRSSISGHAGFPDLVMVRSCITVIAELKTQRGRLRQTQKDWLAAWEVCTPGDVDERFRVYNESLIVAVWRPTDWPEIERTLK